MICLSSAPDPFVVTEYNPAGSTPNANAGNYNLSGKTPVVLNLAANNCVLPIFGESLASNVCPTAVTPANSGVLNLCIYNGGTYSAVDPLLGCSNAASPLGTGNSFTRLGDAIQGTGKFDNTILVPAGVGGSTMAMLAADTFGKVGATFQRLSHIGLTTTGVLVQLGANDNALGTSQSAYAASQAAFIALIRTYFAGPIFIAKSTMWSNAVSSGIQAAQTGAVDHPNGIWSLGDCDSLTGGTNRQADGTHLTDAGSISWKSLMLAAIQAYGAPFA